MSDDQTPTPTAAPVNAGLASAPETGMRQTLNAGSDQQAADDKTGLKQLGAKTLQSATLGFGADAAGAVWGKDSEVALRKLSNQFDDKHPLAGIGLDLATTGAVALIPGAGETAMARTAARVTGTLAGRTAVGATVGGAAGVGAGGTADQRVKHGTEGAIAGAGVALGLGTAGQFLLKPIFDRMGPAGFSQAKAAADDIKSALTKEGKSVDGLNKFMMANPNARIADYSPKVADLVSSAADKSNETARQLAVNIRVDQAHQQMRIARETQPLMALKNGMQDTADKLAKERDALYDTARGTEVVKISPALQGIINHPDVEPLFHEATAETAKAKLAGRLQNLPPIPDGHTSSYALDETQRKIGQAAEDVGTGVGQQGTLKKLQGDLNAQLTPSMQKAQLRAMQTGEIDRAQQWGGGYAKGLKTSDIEDFRKMSPVAQQYARLGVANGLEDYVRSGRLTEGQFTKLADGLKDPAMVEVLGQRNASQAAKVFKAEAARSRTNSAMVQGGSNRTRLNDLIEENAAAHVVNHATGGIGGSAMRMVQRLGMSEPQARSIIDIATKPGGIARLRKAGIDSNVLDKLQSAVKVKGAMSGAVTQAGRPQDLSQ